MAGKKAASPIAGPGMLSDADYQAQSDHRTLSDAVDIQRDPARMAGVKKHQTRQEKKLALLRKSMTGGRAMTGGGR